MSATAVAAALPEPAAASAPPEARGLTRDGVLLLVVSGERTLHAHFSDFPALLDPGDLVVLNTSRTLPAALRARRGDETELTLHLSTPAPYEQGSRWVVELRRGAECARDGRAGERLALPAGGTAELLAPYIGTRLWVARLELPEPLLDYLHRHGGPIRYGHVRGDLPLERLQNVYATEPGSAEMPSAGRPFSAEAITRLVARGVDVAPVVLHTGVSSLESGEGPYPERFRVPATTADRVNLARRRGSRVIAVGTTVVRALESAAEADGSVRASGGWTELVIGPDRGLAAVTAILTGFHDRSSSHLEMLEALAGPRPIARSYREATRAGYLRHEFGDVMLIEP